MATKVTRKKLGIVALVLLIITMLSATTLAWYSFNAQAQNNVKGTASLAAGRLHDDFEVVGQNYGAQVWTDGLCANKDIYVENYESADDTGKEIYCRVKLYEYMEIGPGATEELLLADNTLNPAYTNRSATPLVQGTLRDDINTWIARLPSSGNASDAFKARFEWGYGGQKTYMPTFNKDFYSDETDIKGNAIDLAALAPGEVQNDTEPGQGHPYADTSGEHDYFDTTKEHTAFEKYWDKDNTSAGAHAISDKLSVHTARPTLDGSVITMGQWKKTPYEKAPGNYWVIDSDGWAYWANPLPPESATGLLLDSVTLRGEPDEDYYYSIYVKADMATRTDWTKESEGGGFYRDENESPTKDATELMYIITGYNPHVSGIYLNHYMTALSVNDTLELKASVLIADSTDPAWQEYTWSVSPAVGSRFTAGVFSPSAQDANTWYSFKATAKKDPTKFAICKVYVAELGLGVVSGKDGNVYVYYVDNNDNTFRRVGADTTLGDLVCPLEVGYPGSSTDRTNVVELKGHHYLDEGNNLYFAYGADGLLGTDDDVLVYESDTGVILPADKSVILSVSPDSPDVTKGNTLDMSASVVYNSIAQDSSLIVWSLIGTHSAGTTLSGTGANATLSVDASESADTLTVRLTYPGAIGTSRDVIVSVKDTFSNVIPDGATTYTDSTGVTWRILKDNRPGAAPDSAGVASTGDGTVLLMTDKIYGTGGLTTWGAGFRYTGTGTNALWVEYPYTSIVSEYNNWYNAYVSDELKVQTCLPNLVYESDSPDRYTQNLDSDISSAGNRTTGAISTGVVFPLSISEVNRYVGSSNNLRIAYTVQDKVQSWWLRSIGLTPNHGIRVLTNGTINSAYVGNFQFGLRPAMWIDTTA